MSMDTSAIARNGIADRPTVWMGWDPSEMQACVVAEYSMRRYCDVDLHRLSLLNLKHRGIYYRPMDIRDGRLWDLPSDAPMSTEHANTRFFVPYLQDYCGWALFTDGDVLVRENLRKLFDCANDRYAVMCVQHDNEPQGGITKKDGAFQLQYHRKNWSSVMLFNCAHRAHRRLSLEDLNTWPGRDLHRFAWLHDYEIGSLPAEWNYLVNVSAPQPNPAIVHYTLGVPTISGHADDPFADEWFSIARSAGYRVPATASAPASSPAMIGAG